MRKSLVRFPLPLQASTLVRGKMRWWQIVYTVGFFLLFYCTTFQKHQDQNLTVLRFPHCTSRSGLSVCVEIAEVPLIRKGCPRSAPCSRYRFAQEEVCSAGCPFLIPVQLATVKTAGTGQEFVVGIFADVVNLVQ